MLDILKAKPDDVALLGDVFRQIEPDYLWNAKVFILVDLFFGLVVFWPTVGLLCLFFSYSLDVLLQLLDLFLHALLFGLVHSKLLLFLHQLISRLIDSSLHLQILDPSDHNEYEYE